jgi:hypothetical protein
LLLPPSLLLLPLSLLPLSLSLLPLSLLPLSLLPLSLLPLSLLPLSPLLPVYRRRIPLFNCWRVPLPVYRNGSYMATRCDFLTYAIQPRRLACCHPLSSG